MKRYLLPKIIALATCVISTVYACKSEGNINDRIAHSHLIVAREGVSNIVQELHDYYIDGFLWLLVIALLGVVGSLLLIELGLNYYVSHKRQQLRSIADNET